MGLSVVHFLWQFHFWNIVQIDPLCTKYTSYMFGILITAPLLAPPFSHIFVNCHYSKLVLLYLLGQSLYTTIFILLMAYYAYWMAGLDVVVVIFNYYDLFLAFLQGRRLCCLNSKAIFWFILWVIYHSLGNLVSSSGCLLP